MDATVPLSAYTIQQDYINNLNDTNRGPSYFRNIPAFIQHNPGDFIAHTFTIGDTFQTNSTFFALYKVQKAYSISGGIFPNKELLNFAYPNNDLSACDVSSITLDLNFQNSGQQAGVVGADVRFIDNCRY